MRLVLALLPAATAFIAPTAWSAPRVAARRVTEFSGEDDKIPELSAEDKDAVLYAVGINLASQFADLPRLVTTVRARAHAHVPRSSALSRVFSPNLARRTKWHLSRAVSATCCSAKSRAKKRKRQFRQLECR